MKFPANLKQSNSGVESKKRFWEYYSMTRSLSKTREENALLRTFLNKFRNRGETMSAPNVQLPLLQRCNLYYPSAG